MTGFSLSYFLKLPVEIAGGVLSLWLNGKSVSRFDIACCKRMERTGLLRLFTSKQLVFNNLEMGKLDVKHMLLLISWVRARHVKVGTITSIGGVDVGVLENYLHAQEETASILKVYLTRPKTDLWGFYYAIALHCRQLQHLSLRDCTLNTSLVTVLRNCPILKELFAAECTGLRELRFGDITCPQLQTVVLNSCDCDEDCVVALLGLGDNICHVSLSGCSGVDTMETPVVTQVFAKLSRLKKLILCGLDISDEFLDVVATHCPQLEELNIGECKQVSDTGIHSLAQHCKKLSLLYMDSCIGVTGESLLEMAQQCPALKTFSVTDMGWGCALDGLAAFCRQCSTLETLFTELIDVALVQSFPGSLRNLTVRGLPTPEDALSAVGMHCPQLTQLVFVNSNCSSKGLSDIAAGCVHLRHLYLCGKLDALALSLWQQMRPNLVIKTGPLGRSPRPSIITEGMVVE